MKMNKKTTTLYEASHKGPYFVNLVPDIKLLENLGLRVGTKIEIQNRYAFGGPVLLRVEDAFSIAIGKDIAKHISVTEISAAELHLMGETAV